MQTNGTSCSIATSATAASEPSPPAIPSTSGSGAPRELLQVVPVLERRTSTPRARAASLSSSAVGESVPELGLTIRNCLIGWGLAGPKDRPFGPCSRRGSVSIIRLKMSERGLHIIEDDLSETWVEDWAAVGLSEIEALLAKHAAFLGYLEEAVDES